MHELVPLNFLASGEGGEVAEVMASGLILDRLCEMGLRPGCIVEMIQQGTPCIIRLQGHKLCLRADELGQILVRPGIMA